MNYKLRKERDMKKLLIGVAVAAMMMTPVAAKAGDNWIGQSSAVVLVVFLVIRLVGVRVKPLPLL